VAHHPVQRIFWALANIKITDLFGAFFLFGCFVSYILEATGEERRKRSAQLLYILLWFEITILLSKEVLITPLIDALSLWRQGPTLVFPDTSYFLSNLISWHKIKDFSHSCFPGDHAIIVYQWCAFFYYFAGKRWGIPTALFSTLFLVPRVISGAHWVSDLLVGSLSIVTLAFFIATSPFVMGRIMGVFYWLVGYKREDNNVYLQTNS
jgi:membrane-associated phospholipid phosphatase